MTVINITYHQLLSLISHWDVEDLVALRDHIDAKLEGLPDDDEGF